MAASPDTRPAQEASQNPLTRDPQTEVIQDGASFERGLQNRGDVLSKLHGKNRTRQETLRALERAAGLTEKPQA